MVFWRRPGLDFPLSQGYFFVCVATWIRISHQVHSKISQQIRVSPISQTLKYLARLWSCSGIRIIPAISKFLRCAAHTALEMPMLVHNFMFLMRHLATQQMEGLWCQSVLSLDGTMCQGPLVSICCAFHSTEVTWFPVYPLAAALQQLLLFLGIFQVSVPISLKLSELSQPKGKSKTGKTTY